MGKKRNRPPIPVRARPTGAPTDRAAPADSPLVARNLTIRGVTYRAIDFRQGSSLHLIELRQQTAALGLGPDGRGYGMVDLEAAAADRSGIEFEVMFAVMVFLTLRCAGVDTTFVEAASIPFPEIGIELDTTAARAEAAAETGPTAPGGPVTPGAPGE